MRRFAAAAAVNQVQRNTVAVEALEKARDAVRKVLARTYATMEEAAPPLRRLVTHLRQSIQTEGDGYAYRPEDPPDWQLK